MAVTADAFVNQCAETARIARGFGSAAPNADHAVVYSLVSNVFIGLPCPKNTAGVNAATGVGSACIWSFCPRAQGDYRCEPRRARRPVSVPVGQARILDDRGVVPATADAPGAVPWAAPPA